MAGRQRLTQQETAAALQGLPGWSVTDAKLHKEFTFKDFNAAFGFVSRVALIAERMNHHPEWWNVYNRVVVDLTTHDVGGISQLDVQFAHRVEELFAA